MRSILFVLTISLVAAADETDDDHLDALNHLPEQHYEFYFKSNREHYERFCSNQQVAKSFNCSRSIDELRCWGYEEDKRCRRLVNKYPVIPGKFDLSSILTDISF